MGNRAFLKSRQLFFHHPLIMEKLAEIVCSKLPWLPPKDESSVILSTCLGTSVVFDEEPLAEDDNAMEKPIFASASARRLYSNLRRHFSAVGMEPSNCLVASMLPPALIRALIAKRIVDSDLISDTHSQFFLYCTEKMDFSVWSSGKDSFRLHKWYKGMPTEASLLNFQETLLDIDCAHFQPEDLRLTECTFYAHLPAFNMLRYDRYLEQSVLHFHLTVTPIHSSEDGSAYTGFYVCNITIETSDTPKSLLKKAIIGAMMLDSIERNARKRLLKHYSLDLFNKMKGYYDYLVAHLDNIPENVAMNACSNLLLGTELGLFPKYAPSVFKMLVSLCNKTCLAYVTHTTDQQKLGAARGRIIAKCLQLMGTR